MYNDNNIITKSQPTAPHTPTNQPIIAAYPATPDRTNSNRITNHNPNTNNTTNLRFNLTAAILPQFRLGARRLLRFPYHMGGCKKEEYLRNNRDDKDDSRSNSYPIPVC